MWLMASKNYANTRYSELNQINTQNVKDLKLAWTFSTGLVRGHKAAPLIVNNTMYIVTPFHNYLYALDLNRSGAMKWVYKPNPAPAAQGAWLVVTWSIAARPIGKEKSTIINTIIKRRCSV